MKNIVSQLPLVNSDAPLKRCPSCPEDDQWHPATKEYFWRNKNIPDGFNTPCKRCQREYYEHPRPVLPPVPEGYKRCTKCKEPKLLAEFRDLDRRTKSELPPASKTMGKRAWCKECERKKRNKTYKKSPIFISQASGQSRLKWKHGLSPEEYQQMFDRQNGLCASCGNPETSILKRTGNIKKLHVDHNHVTGQIPGLLCSACNTALGMLKEDPIRIRALLAYAEECQAQK